MAIRQIFPEIENAAGSFIAKSPAALPFLAGFEPTTFRLGADFGGVLGRSFQTV